MPSPSNRPLTALLALLTLACGHARPTLDARQSLATIQVVASPERPVTVVEGGRGGARVAGGAAAGAITGALAIPTICVSLGYISAIACLVGGYYVGVETVILIESTATVVGAAIKAGKASKEVVPIRERMKAADAAFLPAAAAAVDLEAFAAAARGAPLAAASYRLSGAAPTEAGRSGRLELSLERIALAALDDGLFDLRAEASGALRDSWGKELGSARAVVHSARRWNVAELAEGEGAPLRQAIAELVARAGAEISEELLVSVDRRSGEYGSRLCGLGPLDPGTGRRIEDVAPSTLALTVFEDVGRRTLAWEPWRPDDEPASVARVTYELRLWKFPVASLEEPIFEVRGLTVPRFVLPPGALEQQADELHAWSVRALVESGGKRFATGWSHVRARGGRCGLGSPPPEGLLRLALRVPPPPPPPPPTPAPDMFEDRTAY